MLGTTLQAKDNMKTITPPTAIISTPTNDLQTRNTTTQLPLIQTPFNTYPFDAVLFTMACLNAIVHTNGSILLRKVQKRTRKSTQQVSFLIFKTRIMLYEKKCVRSLILLRRIRPKNIDNKYTVTSCKTEC